MSGYGTKGPNTRLVDGVRYREGEFQLRCNSCRAINRGPCYWPLTLDFWEPEKGMSRCRACWNGYQRRRMLEARANDPNHSKDQRRRYYREARKVILLKKRERYWKNREAILAARRAAYAAKREAMADGAA